MATLIEANSQLSKEAITRLQEIACVHPQAYQYEAPACTCTCQKDCSSLAEGAAGVRKCTQVTLSCAQVALKMWGEGFRGTEYLQRLVSHSTVKDIIDVVETIDAHHNALDIDDLAKHPVFASTVTIEPRGRSNEDLNTLLSAWFLTPLEGLSIVICQRVSEVVACLRIPFEDSLLYAVFDPHPPSDHRAGPTFILSSEMTDLAVLKPFADSLSAASAKISTPLHTQLNALEEQEATLLSGNTLYLNLSHDGAAPVADSQALSRPPLSTQQEQQNNVEAKCSHAPEPLSTARAVHHHDSSSLLNKQKEKWSEMVSSLCNQDNKENISLLLPWVVEQESSAGHTPYPSTDSLLKSLASSSPTSLDMSPSVAGPSRVGSPESRVYSLDLQSLEAPLEIPRYELSPSATLVGGDEWQFALIQQLQEEEELVAATGNQVRISHDNAWIVTVQKQRRAEQTTTASGFSSSSVVSLELDWQLAMQLQEAERNALTRNRPRSQHNPTATVVEPGASSVSLPLPLPQPNTFECGICAESCNDDVKVSLVVCGHSYCRDCLAGFVKSKIEDSRFPIFCPECLIDRSVRNKCHVTREAMDNLNLSERELKRIEDLEILSHSVILECHRCNHRMDMPRGDYSDKKVISCTRTGCTFHWCKNCNKALGAVEERHKCKNENIERLMRRRGWKHCPGCRTPVQKESGCNHMTCGAPGCNVHFCYKCGVLIVDTTNGGDVGLTVTEHYANSKCRLFERRFLNCTIM